MARTIPKDRFQDLIEAATGVFLDQGYRRTQMADVAARMGLAKGTLYLYVESKEALFHAVVEHADRAGPIELPQTLPLPTPGSGETLEAVRKRVAEVRLPVLADALARRRVTDVRAELEAILGELYGLLSQNRVGIKLLDRCSKDHPELASVWFGSGREGVQELLRLYLEDRIRRRRLPAVEDAAVTARIVLETAVFWAVHRYWDPSPQAVAEDVAQRSAVDFIVRSLSNP